MDFSKSFILNEIELLENRIDLTTIDEIYLFKLLDYFFPTIPVGINLIQKGSVLYRGRPSGIGPSFKRVNDFSFVPFDEKLLSRKYGRCNRPTQSLFYCANSIEIAQMECLTHHTDFTIDTLSYGKWIAMEDILVADIHLPEMQEIKVSRIANKREHFHNLLKVDLNEKEFEYANLISDFFGRQFGKSNITNDRQYLYSVYLTNRLLDGEVEGKKIDGVKYPSIATLYQGDNVVLKPEVILSHKLKLVETYEIISGISQGKLFSSLTNQSIEINNETIIWRDNEVIHGGGYFADIGKTPLEKGGQGFLTIILKFNRQNIISVLKEMDTSSDLKGTLELSFTVNCERFVENYIGLVYNEGTFRRCYINEKENLIRLTTPWGYLNNFNGEIMFFIDGKGFTFYSNSLIEIGFIPSIFDSEAYKDNI